MIIKIYEKYTEQEELEDIKDKIMSRAIESNNADMIDFFIQKGYDYDDDNIITSMYNNNSFRYFLGKGVVNIKELYKEENFKRRLYDTEVQKALIDFDYEEFIHDTVGFSMALKNDPKYAKIVKRFEEQKKYNL